MGLFGRDRSNAFRPLLPLAFLACGCYAVAQQDLKSLVQQAFDFHRKGQFAEALPLLRRAYHLDPNDYLVNLLLGIDSLRTGQPDSAVLYLKKASRLRPREEFPLDYLGEAYARQDAYGDAAEAYLRVARIAPGSPDSAIAFVDFALSRVAAISATLRSSKKGLAAEYRLQALGLGAGDEARLPLLQRAADLDPTVPGIWSDLALAALARGDLSLARDSVHHALQANPNDLEAEIADAQLAGHEDDWKKAFGRLQAVAQHSPFTLSRAASQWPTQLLPASEIDSGATGEFFSCVRNRVKSCHFPAQGKATAESPTALYREQRWEQLTRLPAPRSVQPELWLRRGVALANLEECPRAIPALERGLSKSAPDIYGMYLLSWCYSREAGQTADLVQQSAGDDAPVHVMRGDVLLRLQSKSEMAAAEYELALAKAPDDPAVLARLAEAQFSAGKLEAARENAQVSLKLDPLRLAAKRTLARVAMQNRDYATALPYLKEIVARDPQDIVMRIELGKACAQTGALDEARENLAPALERGYPDERGSLHYLLGNVLRKMGRTVEADQALATAAQLSEAFQKKSYGDQEPDTRP
jgi:tetratricopeptide (TPR) repeat protein